MVRPTIAILLATCALAAGEPEPLLRAHAHNDYLNKRPLHDALEQGFCSVEVDVFFEKGEFRVGHFSWTTRKGRTLESLYLAPLAKRVQANKGSVYGGNKRFILLVDLKTDGNKAYASLDALLTRYREILDGRENGVVTKRAVSVVLSGGSPRGPAEADPTCYCAIDGRPPDLGTKTSTQLVPLVSDSWKGQFKWRGRGDFPPAEAARLKEFVNRAHQDGRLLRFWAVPDNEASWKVLHDAGVDLINTDKLTELAKFLRSRRKEKSN